MRRLVTCMALVSAAAGLAVALSQPATASGVVNGSDGAAVARHSTGTARASSSDATSSYRYTSITPDRLLDTRQTHTPVAAHGTADLVVAGEGAVPADAQAVSLNLTVVTPAAAGHLTAYPTGTAGPTVSNVNFAKNVTVANAAVEKIGTDGRLTFANSSASALTLLIDVTGYYDVPAPGVQGGFVPLTPARLLDTRTTNGGHHSPVAANSTVDLEVGSRDGVPDDASAVVLNLTAVTPTRAGHLIAYPTGSTAPTVSNVNFGARQTVPDLAVVPLGDHSKISIKNVSSGTTDLLVDVTGYFTAGSAATSGAFGALSPVRLLDTRYGNGAPRRAVAANGTVTLHVTGRGGVPLQHVSAVVLTVTVTASTRAGHLVVYPSGTPPTASTLNFGAGRTVPNLVFAKLDADGNLRIRNSSGGTSEILADVSGFVLDTDRDVPAVTTSRYVSSLDAISGTDESQDASEGCTDGKSGASLVLLDVGAQTVTGFPSGTAGVSLVGHSDPVRVSYTDLDKALTDYVDDFVACLPHGTATAPRIAIGTNNDGQFTAGEPNYYAPTTRGADWAKRVVANVQEANAAVHVVGAIDLESGFASTEAQAQQWETAFLGADAGTDLIDNGDLQGCPDTYDSASDCAAVRSGDLWTLADYVKLTYGNAPGRISVLPQIYFANHPDQVAAWVNLDRVAGSRLTFEGSLTQSGLTACGTGCGYTGAQGWAALQNGLSSLLNAPQLPVASNLQPA